MELKFRYRQLFLWFLVYYIFHNPLKDLILHGETDFFNLFVDFRKFTLNITFILSYYIATLLSYASFFYFFRLRRWGLFAITLVLAFILPVALRYGLEEIFLPWIFGFDNYSDEFTATMYYRDNFYFYFEQIIVGIVFYIYQYGNHKEAKQQELEQVNQQMELSLLKSQTNPHFLLNSLNNIYSLVFHKSEDALPAIENLSGMLKYALYDNRKLVTLEEEMQFVKKYIQLQKLRYEHDVTYEIDYPADLSQTSIPQFVIVPIIENIFKHGDMSIAPAFSIAISAQKGVLAISAKNKISAGNKDAQGGIGLANMKKRLHLLYGDQAVLNTKRSEKDFLIEIKIPLNS